MNDKSLSLQDLGFLPENIETLFKVEPPVTRIKNGYGYIGVLLRDKEKDLLQCHMCGEWTQHLSAHTRWQHGILSREYKIKFGLPLSFPMVSRRLSKVMSDNVVNGKGRNWLIKHKKGNPKTRKNKKPINNSDYGLNSASFRNKKGLCDEQIERRFLIVADIVGRNPTDTDLRRHDSKLLYVLSERIGGTNTYRKKMGYDINHIQQKRTKEEVLIMIKELAVKMGGGYSQRIFKKRFNISSDTITKMFGGWNKALIECGLNPTKIKYSDDDLLAILRKFYKEKGRIPRKAELTGEEGRPWYKTFTTRFGSMNRAYATAGII